MLKLGDAIVLPKGTPVGMGRLKSDAEGVVDRIELDAQGGTFYGVSFTVKGKPRRTYITADEVRKVPR